MTICLRRRDRACRSARTSVPALALLLLLAACSYRGSIDDPAVRRLTWFSYISGDDIRAACGPTTLDRYRLVYNAHYEEQVRSYEVVDDAAGGAILVARALGPSNLALVTSEDPLAPWRWNRSEARLSAAEFAAFKQRLAESGFYAGAPVGLRLFGGDFWWVGSGCADGQFHFSAWRYAPGQTEDFAFADFLFAHDATGLPVNPPRAVGAEARFGPRGRREQPVHLSRFVLEVQEEGVGGGLRGLF